MRTDKHSRTFSLALMKINTAAAQPLTRNPGPRTGHAHSSLLYLVFFLGFFFAWGAAAGAGEGLGWGQASGMERQLECAHLAASPMYGNVCAFFKVGWWWVGGGGDGKGGGG